MLITGGNDGIGYSKSVEIFDPRENTVTKLADLNVARVAHSSFVRSDGKVVIIGGFGTNCEASESSTVELYDPSDMGSTKFLTSLPVPFCYEYSAVQTSSDEIVLLGGYSPSLNLKSTAVVKYNLSGNGTATILTSLPAERAYHETLLLPNGEILLIGGVNFFWARLNTIYRYNPTTGVTVTLPATLSTPRMWPFAVLRADGKVMIGGGYDDFNASLASVEILDQPMAREPLALGPHCRLRTLFQVCIKTLVL